MIQIFAWGGGSMCAQATSLISLISRPPLLCHLRICAFPDPRDCSPLLSLKPLNPSFLHFDRIATSPLLNKNQSKTYRSCAQGLSPTNQRTHISDKSKGIVFIIKNVIIFLQIACNFFSWLENLMGSVKPPFSVDPLFH